MRCPRGNQNTGWLGLGWGGIVTTVQIAILLVIVAGDAAFAVSHTHSTADIVFAVVIAVVVVLFGGWILTRGGGIGGWGGGDRMG